MKQQIFCKNGLCEFNKEGNCTRTTILVGYAGCLSCKSKFEQVGGDETEEKD